MFLRVEVFFGSLLSVDGNCDVPFHSYKCYFLNRCAMKGEEDYRPLFENFVYDLLATVNKPEWPAAELLLSLLGRLLVSSTLDFPLITGVDVFVVW